MALAIAGLCMLALWYADASGRNARRGPDSAQPRVFVVSESRELYTLLTSSGVHGARLVYMSAYLHFVPVDAEPESDLAGSFVPIPGYNLLGAYERVLDHTNFLWLLMQAGVARRVEHVLPPDEYAGRMRSAEGSAGLWLRDGYALTHEDGSPRVMSPALLPSSDRADVVLLGIDASYMAHAGGADVLRMIASPGMSPALVILNMAVDNPDVTESGREAMRALSPEVESLVRGDEP
jgi:hypothetical protein